MSAETDQLLIALEQSRNAVATLTGMKQQFVEAGWEPGNAERAVLELMATSRTGTPKG